MAKKKKTQIERLSDWDWETLVAAWRYYETRTSASSAGFPGMIVSRYWRSGDYAKKVLDTIAHQFAITDHGLTQEEFWSGPWYWHCDRLAWTKFYRFCEGWINGFAKVSGVEAFRVDWNGIWYPVSAYIENPDLEGYIPEKSIREIVYPDKNQPKGRTKAWEYAEKNQNKSAGEEK